jgi:hypothetical protein
MKPKILQFVVVMLLALALVPVGAHLLALPNKIDLPQDQYFVVQAIYLGWALPSGVVLIGAIVTSLALTVLQRGQGPAFWLSLVAFVAIAATLVVFFTWTQPANAATVNWTVAPADWNTLRTQWEYSHAVNAVLTFVALCAALASTLVTRSERIGEGSARRNEPARVG